MIDGSRHDKADNNVQKIWSSTTQAMRLPRRPEDNKGTDPAPESERSSVWGKMASKEHGSQEVWVEMRDNLLGGGGRAGGRRVVDLVGSERRIAASTLEGIKSDAVAELSDSNDRGVALLNELPETCARRLLACLTVMKLKAFAVGNGKHTRQLVTSQSECLTGNLFVNFSLQLENNTADRQTDGPVVEFTFTLTHTLLVTLGVDTNVGTHALVELVVHSSQSSLNCLLGDLQSRSGHAAVVILHPDTIISPHHCSSSCGSSSCDMGTTLRRLGLFGELRGEPILGSRCVGKASCQREGCQRSRG